MDIQKREELRDKYSYLEPLKNMVALKRIKEENTNIVASGYAEEKSYGRVIALSDTVLNLTIGDLVSFNEFEGQELFKYNSVVDEDDIILISIDNILVKINEK